MIKLDSIQNKIKDKAALDTLLAFWRFKNYKIVFTNGCFDIIHRGHIEYLSKAADLGDVLIIGLNSDASVKSIKGESRPLQDEKTRALILSSFSFVSAVSIFEEDTPYNLISTVKPDILVKGGDYKPENIVGYDIVKEKGGEIISLDFVNGFSTTSIINKMS